MLASLSGGNISFYVKPTVWQYTQWYTTTEGGEGGGRGRGREAGEAGGKEEEE